MAYSVWSKVKQSLLERKRWIGLALILFILEFMLLIWPAGWINEDVTVTMDSGDMRLEQMTEEKPEFCQEFVPQHGRIGNIQLFFTDVDQTLGDGEVVIAVSDREKNVLFRRTYSYSALTYNLYMDIAVNLRLQSGETYYLTVTGYNETGEMPSLALCGMAQGGPENRKLTRGDEEVEGQLLMTYQYTDVLTRRALLIALCLCLVTALGVALGTPKNRKVRIALGVILLLIWPWIAGMRLEQLTVRTYDMLPVAIRWTLVLMYIIELIILLCTLSLRATVIITNVAMTLLYTVNFFVYAYRGVPLKINDFTAIGTAVNVMSGYEFQPNHRLAVAWALMVLFLVLGLKTGVGAIGERKHLKLRYHAAGIVLGFGLAFGVGYWLLYTNFVFEAGFQNTKGFGINNIYQFNGYLIATCMDIQKSRVKEPEGYSRERAVQILEEADRENAKELPAEELPHIILVMNESFSDLRTLGNLEISQENLSFFNSLKENTIRGNSHASTLGGGTANTEFEVFTGCSMGFLPKSCYPYQQYLKRPLNSLISSMKAAGYTTYSMHPETQNNWNRISVYRYLGFENSLWKDDFEGAEILHFGAHAGVVDRATYDKVEEIYENRKQGEKLFIFDLTLQNHGGYKDDKALQKDVTAVNVDSLEADTYLSLIKRSDEDFEQLIRYFEKQDEKVMICMFGDHQPKFSDEGFYEDLYSQTPGLTGADKVWNQYITPFVIWTNYDMEEKEDVNLSMNYLGVFLQKTAGIPLSPYFAFLAKQMEEYPVITVNGYMDAAGNRYEWSDNRDEFPDYRVLQYNYLFDPLHTVEWGY